MNQRPGKRYLVVCTLRIGDVLLTTPVLRAIRQHDPDAWIEVLVLPGMAGILEGNPDIDRIVITPHRTGVLERLKEFGRLWRRYDVALTTVSSDRARWYCFVAGKVSAGPYNPHSAWLSVRLLNRRILFDDLQTHTVCMGLKVLDLLGIPRQYQVIPPSAGGALPAALSGKAYAVLHPFPKFRYKMWPQDHWMRLIGILQQEGLTIALTGSPEPDELAYVSQIARSSEALNLCGQLSLAQIADLIAGARFFVGPDTGITHLAAATGVATVALFGPSNPVKWGPWPTGWQQDASPWILKGSQQWGNVHILQGPGDCVPCREEGCEKRVDSHSDCLDHLELSMVLETLRQLRAT